MPEPESSENIKDYLSNLLSGNAIWAQRMNQTFQEYFCDPKDKQAPKVLWIGCSDSRVQESDATRALPGAVFVHRNIANQFHLHDDNVLSVFAYAVKELCVQHVVIVGHEHCGGAVAALKEAIRCPHAERPEHHLTLFDSLYHLVHWSGPNDAHDTDSKDPMDAITRWLTPLINRIRELQIPPGGNEEEALHLVIKENVKLQIGFIAEMDEWVRKHAAKRPVWVHGLVYDFSTGFIRDLKVTKELGGNAA